MQVVGIQRNNLFQLVNLYVFIENQIRNVNIAKHSSILHELTRVTSCHLELTQ